MVISHHPSILSAGPRSPQCGYKTTWGSPETSFPTRISSWLMSCTSTGSNATLFENGMYIGINLQDILYGKPGMFVPCGLTDPVPGIELFLYFKTMRIFLARRRQRHKCDIFYAVFSTVMLVLITIWVAALGAFGQKMWLLDRNYPGGPMGYYETHTPVLYMDFGRVALTILQQMTDALMVRLGGRSLARNVSLISLRFRFTAAGLCGALVVSSSCRRSCG